jgi:hypothetical protein
VAAKARAGRTPWPPPRAAALGFIAASGIDEVVRAFIEDDLDMQKRLA